MDGLPTLQGVKSFSTCLGRQWSSTMTDKTTENSIEQLDRLIEALDHQLLEDNTAGEEKKVVFHNTDTALIRLYLDAIRLRTSICQGISLENDEAEGAVPQEALDYEPFRDV